MDKPKQKRRLINRNNYKKRKLTECCNNDEKTAHLQSQCEEEMLFAAIEELSVECLQSECQGLHNVITLDSAVSSECTTEASAKINQCATEESLVKSQCATECISDKICDRFSSDADSNSSDSEDYTDNECSNDNSDEIATKTTILKDDLIKWSKEVMIPYVHLDKLLKILHHYHSELPLCSKTLLRRNVLHTYDIHKFDPDNPNNKSEYVYFGIGHQLQRVVNPDLHKDNLIKLQFYVDGLPLFNSSSKEFWPILGKVYHEKNLYQPFEIAVHCGEGKPSSADLFLQDFITELNLLLNNGIEIQGKKLKTQVMCIICDRLARAFVKCIKGHTGYFACERCTVSGCRENRKTVFPVDECAMRSDMSFRNQETMEHHHGVSLLTKIEPMIDMINSFPLDFMHLGCLGVMKRLLSEYWTKLSTKILNREQVLRISQRMMNISSQVPIEFQRTTRSLGELGKWKATEYRFFLLYCSMFVLKDVLPNKFYKHFLLFGVASRILSCKSLYNNYLNHADIYLKKFASLANTPQMYGTDALVLNMHSLIHLADDVKYFNCPLMDVSAFCFENTLGKIKKYLKSGNRPLSQLCRRLEEDYAFEDQRSIDRPNFKIEASKR